MAYDPQGAMERRYNFIQIPSEEKEAYKAAYRVGYSHFKGPVINPAEVMEADQARLAFPNAYGAGYWDGFGDAEADIADEPSKPFLSLFEVFIAVLAFGGLGFLLGLAVFG